MNLTHQLRTINKPSNPQKLYIIIGKDCKFDNIDTALKQSILPENVIGQVKEFDDNSFCQTCDESDMYTQFVNMNIVE